MEIVLDMEKGAETSGDNILVVKNVRTPTIQEVEAHEAPGHANF